MAQLFIDSAQESYQTSSAKPWEKTTPPTPVAPLLYGLGRWFFKLAFFCCVRVQAMHPERARLAGGYVLALTHFSHLEPVCLGVLMRRRIDWMSRIEFFRHRPVAWALRAIDAFSVNRQGVPVKAIRTAIERAQQGRIVGMFPEGGVVHGPDSACRGGPIKQGAALIACRAQVPIVPCVLLGTHRLNCVSAWLPWRRSRLWVIYGDPIAPLPAPPGRAFARLRRANRAALTDQLQRAYIELYAQLRQGYGLCEKAAP